MDLSGKTDPLFFGYPKFFRVSQSFLGSNNLIQWFLGRPSFHFRALLLPTSINFEKTCERSGGPRSQICGDLTCSWDCTNNIRVLFQNVRMQMRHLSCGERSAPSQGRSLSMTSLENRHVQRWRQPRGSCTLYYCYTILHLFFFYIQL